MPVRSSFLLQGTELRFSVAPYNRRKTLVIDPGVEWSTYYGGNNFYYASSYDAGNDACVTDTAGNAFLAGNTQATSGVATPRGFQTSYAGGYGVNFPKGDIFLAKFSPSGTRLWATYYGGNSDESIGNVVIDANGAIYLCGTTFSMSGIAWSGFQNT